MSIVLPQLNVSGFVAGQTGKISLASVGSDSNPIFIGKPAHVNIYNESNLGFRMSFAKSGDSHFVGAGAWGTFAIDMGESEIDFFVLNVFPHPQVTIVFAVWFYPSEIPTRIAILGNSPLTIGG